jgi:hypothetical protein
MIFDEPSTGRGASRVALEFNQEIKTHRSSFQLMVEQQLKFTSVV